MEPEIDLGIENLTDVREIGRGGFSVVYSATNTLLGTRVAVKVLGRLTDQAERARFERECQVMGRLSRHPSVVTVHHAGYALDGSPYLVMELVEGGSLGDRLVRTGPMPWPETLDHAIPIADALAYVHEANILHRDVKPENILIGAGGEPLLTDFGIARLGDNQTNTASGITASWMHAPPETFHNRREPRSDLYSLASTIYEALVGHPPFWRGGEDSLNPLMYRLMNEAAPRLGPTVVPRNLDDLIARALAKSPEDRPANLGAFAQELRSIRATATAPPAVLTQPVASSQPGFEPNPVTAAASPPAWFVSDRGAGPAFPQAPASGSGVPSPGGARPGWPTPPQPAVDGRTVAAGGPPVPPRSSRVGGQPSDNADERRLAPLVLLGLAGLAAVVAIPVLTLLLRADSGSTEAENVTTTATAPETTAFDSATTIPLTAEVTTVPATSSGRLAEVRSRGTLNCGINGSFPRFSLEEADGSYSGFDVDFCRVVAAAVLGDADAVNYVPLTAAERFVALETNQVDVLMRNTSQTATRAGELGLEFPFTTFFDGQSLMVRASSSYRSIVDLEGAVVCALAGTTTALTLEDTLAAEGVIADPRLFETSDEIADAYTVGECDAWSSDVSHLMSLEALLPDAGDHIILPQLLSSEPLGPVIVAGDSEWSQAVRWSVMATVHAWEAGIDSTNIASYDGNDITARLIAGLVEFDPGFGLQDGYPRLVVEQVGNYEEIYNAHFTGSGLPLAGSANDLARNGGQMSVPPLR